MQKHIFHTHFIAFLACWSLIAIIASVGGIAQADQLSVEVVDWQAQEVQVLNARIFVPTPTSCDSCPPKIITLDGIKVRDDEQIYIIPWDVIESVEKEDADTGTIKVVLTDGTLMTVELDENLEQFLSGDVNPDEYYVIPMSAVQRLNVMREH